jgi:hypothetical protein
LPIWNAGLHVNRRGVLDEPDIFSTISPAAINANSVLNLIPTPQEIPRR